jgi:hypothetical protein
LEAQLALRLHRLDFPALVSDPQDAHPLEGMPFHGVKSELRSATMATAFGAAEALFALLWRHASRSWSNR